MITANTISVGSIEARDIIIMIHSTYISEGCRRKTSRSDEQQSYIAIRIIITIAMTNKLLIINRVKYHIIQHDRDITINDTITCVIN